MHIWIDIDKVQQLTFTKALISELKDRSHTITFTLEDRSEIRKELKNNPYSEAKTLGTTISIFGWLEEQSTIYRATLLASYTREKNIDIAFSLGSKSLLYSCINLNKPLILFLDDYKRKLHWLYFATNCFFLFSDNTPDSLIIENGFDIKRIAKYKGNTNPQGEFKGIKDLVNQIEFLSKRMADINA